MKPLNNKLVEKLKHIAKWVLLFLGFIFFFIIVLAFTEQPFWWYYNLGKANSEYKFKPDTYILLGGAGMPSESNLIRAYYSIELLQKNPNSNLIIALPEDSLDESHSLKKLKDFIIKNGIDSNKIFLENKGKNTREQALKISEIDPLILNKKVVIITSPEHMYRSISCFKKLKFKHIGGEPCFENANNSEISFDDDGLKGRKSSFKIGKNTQLRYQFWNHLKYQVLVYREYLAYFYYQLRGWV